MKIKRDDHLISVVRRLDGYNDSGIPKEALNILIREQIKLELATYIMKYLTDVIQISPDEIMFSFYIIPKDKLEERKKSMLRNY